MADVPEPTCVICEKDLEVCCTTNCGHTTCEECALKYFVLEQKSSCILCRKVDPKLGFYKYTEGEVLDYRSCKLQLKIRTKKFNFQSQSVYEKVLSKMSYKCPKDERVFGTFEGIKNHVNRDHSDYVRVCNLCCGSNKILPCHTTFFFKNEDLQKHITQGNPDIGFEGHPACKFCKQERFYSSDELKDHMSKSKHVSCYVCKEIPSVLQKDSWFLDSLALDTHLKKSHFACYRSECPLTAFANRQQLEMHDVETHGVTQANFLYGANNDSNVIQNRETSQTANEDSTFADNSELGMRKLRFKERARHYWGHSAEKMDLFFESNDCYLNSEISINDLVEIYRTLFSKSEKEEQEELKTLSKQQQMKKTREINEKIALLLSNFAITISQNKHKYNELMEYSRKLSPEVKPPKGSTKKSSDNSVEAKLKQISLSASSIQNAHSLQPKVFQPLPKLPGSSSSSAAFADSPYFKSTAKQAQNEKLPTLNSLSDAIKKKSVAANPKNKTILTGAGQSLLTKKNPSSKSQPNILPSLYSLSGNEPILPASSSNQSIQVIPNNTFVIRNQAILHSKTPAGNTLPSLPKLAKQENVKAKEIRMKILQKKQKSSSAETKDMTLNYQSRLEDIRGRAKKIEDRGLMKEWARL